MKKNDEIILEITDVTNEGSGIGKYDGMAVFVPLTAVGDTAKVKILKVKKTYAFGKLTEIVTPSADRIECDCPVFNKCGGCSFRHISYSAESKLKRNTLYETVKRLGGVDLIPEDIVTGNDLFYRNKAQYPIDLSGKFGFFAFHSHRIVPFNNCRLQPPIFKDIINATENWVKNNSLSIYNEEKHSGLLRHLYIRIAEITNEIMITLVINGDGIPNQNELIESLRDICNEDLKSVQLNINKSDTNVILGDKCVCLFGDEYITDVLCGIKVRLSPLSFYQVNRNMAEKLYLKACEYAEPEGKKILDLYCGAGTIGLSMAKDAESIIGVEIVKEAVEDAKFNAENNNIHNARFICSDALSASEQLSRENIHPDTVIVDPPRKGLTPELIKIICNNFKPERVVYVSCDVGTFARDVKLFSESGYNLIKYTPVDLFPRTAHVETVALLVRTEFSILI